MKVLISTTQNAINYGAVLQSYALGKYLENMGVQCVFLNFIRKSKLYFVPFCTSSLRLFLSSVYNNGIRLRYLLATHQMKRNFSQFVSEKFKMTKEYRTVEELQSEPPQADIYMTGGDQMFNCHGGVGVQGFLRFGDSIIKRYSYSTSMGIKEPPVQYLSQFIESINQYKSISLREKAAQDFIDKNCNVKTQVHIDSVFLLKKSEWLELLRDQKAIYQKPYILVYQLLQHPLTSDTINQWKAKTSLDVVVIAASPRNDIKADKVIRNAGPIEFINLFAYADKVVTTSFHGTCFSILFEKDFYCLINSNREVRINNLIREFRLTERMISESINVSWESVDFSKAREKIEYECKRTREYLCEVLNK